MKHTTTLGTIIAATAVITLALLLIACTQVPSDGTGGTSNNLEPSGEMKKFSSQQELQDYLKKTQATQFFGMGGIRGLDRSKSFMEGAVPMAANAAGSSEPGGATDYSQTNVQVAGVDEADFVKNDDKYIYVLSQNKLVIVDAYPAENSKIISKTDLDGNARNLFVNKNRLIVFVEGYDETYSVSRYDFIPRPVSVSATHILVYDITDRTSPKLMNDYKMKGYYYESRMIGDYVYFIVNENIYYYGDVIPMPRILETTGGLSKTVARPDVFYFDNPEDSYNFNTIGSFNVFSDDEMKAETFMMGYSNTLYMSLDAIYIAYQKNMPWRYYETQTDDRFYKAVLPLLPQDAQNQINLIKNDEEKDHNKKWDGITAILEETYNGMDESTKKALIKKIEKALEEYDFNLQKEQAKTIVHKITINNGDIAYKARGEFEGRLLNQFSLDEFEGNLRVATTTELYARESITYNNIYVLDEGMNVIGKLEKLAPDEKIYSARFAGEKLYLVTFKRIDPLFVIDLSNPTSPAILGELKIPGFSDYLHPYDENHLIGIGKETEGNEWGGVSVKGLKIALFDVTDVNNPKQIDQYEIGTSGTDSEALHEHKAFLFDKEKNLLVIPVTEASGKIYDSQYGGYYRQKYWQGAYVFTVTETGIELKGKISHAENEEGEEYYYYGGASAVRRSIFMDNVLYTISMKKIKMNDLSNLTKINELALPYDGPY